MDNGITKGEALKALKNMLEEAIEIKDEVRGQALIMALLAVATMSNLELEKSAKALLLFMMISQLKKESEGN